MANITPENEISSRTNIFTALLYRIIPYIECFREYAETIESRFMPLLLACDESLTTTRR